MTFLNGLVNMLNVEMGEKAVNVNSSTNEKIDFISRLAKELDQGFADDAWLKEVLRQS